jgi:hypothetical protein
MLQLAQHSAAKLHTHERGGLTSQGNPSSVSDVSHFAFCRHCDIETPVDNLNTCSYCFHEVSDDEHE